MAEAAIKLLRRRVTSMNVRELVERLGDFPAAFDTAAQQCEPHSKEQTAFKHDAEQLLHVIGQLRERLGYQEAGR